MRQDPGAVLPAAGELQGEQVVQHRGEETEAAESQSRQHQTVPKHSFEDSELRLMTQVFLLSKVWL